jgi:hypothetical protein
MRATPILILLIIFVSSCGTSRKIEVEPSFEAGPPTIVYKTKADYNNLVPVILSDDKSQIISYPHHTDIYSNGELAYPTALADGYLLDNRGISANVAFLNISYEDYGKMKNLPSVDSLFNLIIDVDPLVVLYDCGNKNHWDNVEVRMNEIISKKKLRKCKKLY